MEGARLRHSLPGFCVIGMSTRIRIHLLTQVRDKLLANLILPRMIQLQHGSPLRIVLGER